MQFLRRIQPRDENGLISKRWKLCKRCKQYRPTEKEYWAFQKEKQKRLEKKEKTKVDAQSGEKIDIQLTTALHYWIHGSRSCPTCMGVDRRWPMRLWVV